MAGMDDPLSDLALARRLERCEASANLAFVDARARLEPNVGATWIECAGAHALFDGVGSPLTQTFGLGIFQTPTDADLARIDAFFDERGALPFHEVSPLAGMETIDVLDARGYRPVELTSVMFQSIAKPLAESETRVTTRIAKPSEIDLWAETCAQGWSEFTEVAPMMRGLARVSGSAECTSPFFAELDGSPIATGALAIHGGVALLAGASTIPAARRQGAQRALLEARLRHAAERGCDLAMMCALPGSASQRNAEREGFRIAYTRIKWGRR
jgi:GNAT superfamily N-acetyltransferase